MTNHDRHSSPRRFAAGAARSGLGPVWAAARPSVRRLVLLRLLALFGVLTLSTLTGVGSAQEHESARIEGLPTWHTGSPFTFELHFTEERQRSYHTVRDELFLVEGGLFTRAQRITHGDDRSWRIEVWPQDFGAVSFAGLGMSAAVPGPGERLAASITAAPFRHLGRSFEVRLEFNHPPLLSYRALRDEIVVATGGTVTRAQRIEPGDNSAWTLTIEPDGGGTVGIAIPITESCQDARAV